MIRLFASAVLLLFTFAASSNELGGAVCLGPNLSKVAAEHSDQLYLTVSDSANIYFERPYTGPSLVVTGLDMSSTHLIKVYFGGKLAESWMLNFHMLKTSSVLIWREAGAWRMEPNQAGSCKQRITKRSNALHSVPPDVATRRPFS